MLSKTYLLLGSLALSSFPQSAIAWGCVRTALFRPEADLYLSRRDSGHEAIGYIAQAFLGPKTLAFVKATLDKSYNGQLGPAATWADSIKYTTGWTWFVELLHMSTPRRFSFL